MLVWVMVFVHRKFIHRAWTPFVTDVNMLATRQSPWIHGFYQQWRIHRDTLDERNDDTFVSLFDKVYSWRFTKPYYPTRGKFKYYRITFFFFFWRVIRFSPNSVRAPVHYYFTALFVCEILNEFSVLVERVENYRERRRFYFTPKYVRIRDIILLLVIKTHVTRVH